jgi:hypothetical protein
MVFDSTVAASLLLIAAAVFSARPGTGNYLRFAAILCAALAAALLSRVAGLGAAAALVALPLAGAALGLSALARTRRRAPPLAASMALAASLTAGLFAFFTGMVTAALLPLALGGVAMLLSGRVFAMLSGLLLLAAACAGLSAGLDAALLSLLAASLFGAGLYRRVSSRGAGPASPAP